MIRAPSGKIYISLGDDISGEDDEPDENSKYYQGGFLDVEKGNYLVSVKKVDTTIHIAINKTAKPANNQIDRQLRLTDDS